MYTTSRERGAALMIVLVLLIVLIGGAGILVEVSRVRNQQAQEHKDLTRAKLMAEAAIGIKINQMSVTNDPNVWRTPMVGQSPETGWWAVTATPDPTDVSPGLTEKPWTIKGFAWVGPLRDGNGSVNRPTRAMESRIKRANVDMLSPVGALTILGASAANVTLAGNSFLISGDDTNINGSAGSGGSEWGIATDNDQAANDILAAITGGS